jgi:hypothetical protein
LEVKDCKVIEICNLERTFVLTWPTIRYWIPEIGRLGNAIEKLCCPSYCEEESSGPSLTNRAADADPSASYAQAILRLIMAGCGIRIPLRSAQTASFAGGMSEGIIGTLRDFTGLRTEIAAGVQAAGAKAGASIEPNTVNEFTEKLKAAQASFDQLSREHRRLLDRVGKLEKAVAKKGAHPDA